MKRSARRPKRYWKRQGSNASAASEAHAGSVRSAGNCLYDAAMNSATVNFNKWLACAALAVGLVAFASATQIQEGEPPEGQARAEQVVGGLENPWAMAFLPNDEGILITERPGRLRLWNGAALSEPIKGVPAVFARSQGGLLDVAIAPDFERSRRVYLAYAEQDERGRA